MGRSGASFPRVVACTVESLARQLRPRGPAASLDEACRHKLVWVVGSTAGTSRRVPLTMALLPLSPAEGQPDGHAVWIRQLAPLGDMLVGRGVDVRGDALPGASNVRYQLCWSR